MCGWASPASPAGMCLQRSLTNATLSQHLVVGLVLLAKALCEQAPSDTGEADFAACARMLFHAHHLVLIAFLLMMQGGHFGGSGALQTGIWWQLIVVAGRQQLALMRQLNILLKPDH